MTHLHPIISLGSTGRRPLTVSLQSSMHLPYLLFTNCLRFLTSRRMTADNRDPETSKSSLKEKLPVMSIPVGRPAREEEMASAIIYLAAGEYLHGTILSVDGGFSLSQP